MKLQELFEGPYHIDSEYRPHIKMDSYPSLSGLERENINLGRLEREDEIFHFWLAPSLNVAKVTTAGIDEINQGRQLVVVQVRFDHRATNLPIPKMLQVNTAYTHADYRGKFLAGALYILLVRYGYSVVSDFEQYNGGKGLWKKMAKEAEMRKFVVRVWDDETEDWKKNEHGEIMKYDASNLDDEQVWKDISRNCEPTTLLVLQSK